LAREFSTKSGPIDALGVDKDGELYLIETKFYKNPDKRTVVAQVLDYGASLWSNFRGPLEILLNK
jgi:RecB family endonuclease NucS